jgi:hypothetical protein
MGRRWKSEELKTATIRDESRGKRGRAARAAMLAELEKRFERFRAEHARGTRVPGALRAAALAALGKGVSAGELYRSCGVSRTQIEAWRSSRRKIGGHETTPADVRVFSVVDREQEEPPSCVDPWESAEIELRVGPWSVRIGRADRTGGD